MIPQARPPLPAARAPRPALPPGACDAHVHVFAGPAEHPRDPARAEDPAPGALDDWVGRLRARMAVLGLSRVVLVHSVIYRERMEATLDALARMGDVARGVALVAPDVPDAALDAMHEAGVRAVRLDLVFPGALGPADAPALAARLAKRGWHLQVFARWAEHGERLSAWARDLPCPVVLDHMAYAGPDHLDDLSRAMEGGSLWIKASSLYRQEAGPALDAVARRRPDRLLWGSNWPHVRWDGPMPDETRALEALIGRVDADTAHAALVANPALLYGWRREP